MSTALFRQPKSVWAVAFACVVAFMGIGLVDPILKPIADELGAGPSQVSLLFTSYMAVMGVAMLITGVVSSRIGAKRTLLTGLFLIIVFAFLAGSSSTVGASQVADPGGTDLVDLGEQSALGRRDPDVGLSGGPAVDPGDHLKQLRADRVFMRGHSTSLHSTPM